MKHTTALTALTLATCLGGCQGAYWGNLLVLAVSAGVFYGTLTLQRGTPATRSQAESTGSPASKSL